MTIDDIRKRQAEIFERIADSLGADHGIAPMRLVLEGTSVLYILTELMASGRIKQGKNALQIAIMIDAWLELDDYARSLLARDGSAQPVPAAGHERKLTIVDCQTNARRVYH